MKNLYKLTFICLLCALVACNEDDDPGPINKSIDTQNPTVKLLSPAQNASYLVINLVNISANLSDDMGLGNLRTLLVNANGERKEVTEPITYTNYPTLMNHGNSFYLRDIEPGTYTLVMEVKDRADNVAKDSVTIHVHAPDINRIEFAEAFNTSSFFPNLDWGWFGFDFSNGVEFDETQFSMGMATMINMSFNVKEHEWEKFIQDFRLEKQAWSTLDENGNGELEYTEFQNAIKRLDLFKKWDTNNDRMIRTDEFVKGIFDSWDQNSDNMLTKVEYHDKFYHYLTLLD